MSLAATAVVVAACGARHVESGTDPVCVSIGQSVGRDIDWAPGGETVVVLLQEPGGDLAVTRIGFPQLNMTTVATSSSIVDAGVTIDGDDSTYWQASDSEFADQIQRVNSSQAAEAWQVPAPGLLTIEASQERLYGIRLGAFEDQPAQDAVVEIGLDPSGVVEETEVATVAGLAGLWVSPSDDFMVLSRQVEGGGDITFEYLGAETWHVALDDALPYPIAATLGREEILYRQPSTSRVRSVGPDGVPALSELGEEKVLAFDLSSDGVFAWSTPNFTGGSGAICIKLTSAAGPGASP